MLDSTTKAAARWRIMDIAYGPDPRQQFDLYPAAESPPHTVVVYLHGGGWVTGNRRGGRQLSGPFNQAGCTLVSVGYRLLPDTDLAGCIADVASAVGYLLNHAAELQIEGSRFVIMGHSAGAHMAALLATDDTHLLAAGVDPGRLHAIVALDGIFDVATFLQESTRPMLQSVFGDNPAVWERYSPAGHVGGMRGNARFCLLCEDVNPRFVHQVAVFETALRKNGKSVVSTVVPGLKHAELILLFKRPEQPMLRFVMDSLALD